MEKELPAKESIKEVVAPYGPKQAESKLAFKLGEKRVELLEAARKVVNPDYKDITVLYPASGPDVANVLIATHATKLILVDTDDHTGNIIKEIKDIGGEITKVSYSENKREIDFNWEGKNRKLIFYNLEVTPESAGKLMADVGQYDVYFEKKSQDLGTPEITEKFMGNLRSGGHTITDFEAESHIGLEKCPIDNKFEEEGYWYGHHRLHVHRKVRGVRGIGHTLHLNRTLFNADHTRNGGYIGIDDKAYEPTFKVYREQLTELKKTFDVIPAESREEAEEKEKIKTELIEQLYKAKGDMSKVLDSPENLQKQLEHLIEMRAMNIDSHELFVERIREA